MAAGLATLDIISQPDFYEPLFAKTDALVKGLCAAAGQAGIPMTSNHVGSMWGLFFTDEKSITNYQQVMACDTQRFNRFFHGMLDEGVYLAPASYEAAFMSSAHTGADIAATIHAAEKVFARLHEAKNLNGTTT
jgi:glutamate-1-semialdehyde 2,1-aminomutase